MATYSIRVTRNGQPVVNAKVVVGTLINLQTNSLGEVSKTTAAFTDDLAVPIIIKDVAGNIQGGGPYLLEPGKKLEINL